jgi:hypothetical protein
MYLNMFEALPASRWQTTTKAQDSEHGGFRDARVRFNPFFEEEY